MSDEKTKDDVTLTGVYAGNIRPAKSNDKLNIVRVDLPKSIDDAKYSTGFIAVPAFDVHKAKDADFASVALHAADRPISMQYTDKNENRQTVKVSASDLLEAHKEAKAAYRAKQAEQAEAISPKESEQPAKEAQAEM